MKTKKQVLQENYKHRVIINAIVYKIKVRSIEDVNGMGVLGGSGAFIYFPENWEFYKRYRKHINALVFDMADYFKMDVIEYVLSFRFVNSTDADNIKKLLFEGEMSEENNHIQNALVLFAAEKVCKMFEKNYFSIVSLLK